MSGLVWLGWGGAWWGGILLWCVARSRHCRDLARGASQRANPQSEVEEEELEMVKETRSRDEGPPFPKPRKMFAGDVLPLPRRKSTQTSRLRNAEAYRRRKASSSKNKATTTSGESQKAKESSADGIKQAQKLQQEETSGAPPPEGELPDCKLQSGDDATQADGWTACRYKRWETS